MKGTLSYLGVCRIYLYRILTRVGGSAGWQAEAGGEGGPLQPLWPPPPVPLAGSPSARLVSLASTRSLGGASQFGSRAICIVIDRFPVNDGPCLPSGAAKPWCRPHPQIRHDERWIGELRDTIFTFDERYNIDHIVPLHATFVRLLHPSHPSKKCASINLHCYGANARIRANPAASPGCCGFMGDMTRPASMCGGF